MGDVSLNPYSLIKSVDLIERQFDGIVQAGAKSLAFGGDHTITLPILRALNKKFGQMALVHVDAHSDTK